MPLAPAFRTRPNVARSDAPAFVYSYRVIRPPLGAVRPSAGDTLTRESPLETICVGGSARYRYDPRRDRYVFDASGSAVCPADVMLVEYLGRKRAMTPIFPTDSRRSPASSFASPSPQRPYGVSPPASFPPNPHLLRGGRRGPGSRGWVDPHLPPRPIAGGSVRYRVIASGAVVGRDGTRVGCCLGDEGPIDSSREISAAKAIPLIYTPESFFRKGGSNRLCRELRWDANARRYVETGRRGVSCPFGHSPLFHVGGCGSC